LLKLETTGYIAAETRYTSAFHEQNLRAAQGLRSPDFRRITTFMQLQGRIFIARHGETVFNASGRMQGQLNIHTPLTTRGFAQADEMGRSLARFLGTSQSLHLWSSSAGRAQQTMAIVAEHIGADWRDVRTDDRLQEIDVGDWSDKRYADIIAEQGDIIDPQTSLFSQRPPNGEWYDDIAARLKSWMADTEHERGDRLVIMHGISARVLRGLQRGLPVDPTFGAPIADNVPQGTMVMVGYEADEKIIHLGKGVNHA
jgi:glucosyl-3-phosphoglycerate phosphatase